MDEQRVSLLLLVPHLPERFEERQPLDVAHGAAALNEDYVCLALPRHEPDPALDLVGDVGYDLDASAEVPALPLPPDDLLVDLAAGDVVEPAELAAQEPLIGAEVHVGLVAVFENEDLAVDVGVHGSRVDVEVGVALHSRHLKSAYLKHLTDAAGDQSLPEAAQDAARDKNIFRHFSDLPIML